MPKSNKHTFLIFFILNCTIFASRNVQLDFKKVYEIGREKVFFASIGSVCEDNSGNTYVIDGKEYKILKLTREGKVIKSFGKKGKGPGDFVYPNDINCRGDTTLIITEGMNRISYFTLEGKFLKDLKLTGRFNLKLAGDNLFYAWIWIKEGRQQVLLNARNELKSRLNILPRSKFSVNAPDSTGRLVMFSYTHASYVPAFLFSYYKGYSAVGINDKYDISIFDDSGKLSLRIKRDLKPLLISARERRYLVEDIMNTVKRKRWPKSILNKILARIPQHKTLINRIFITAKFLLVIKPELDITQGEKKMMMDIFKLNGELLGSQLINNVPFYVSDRHFYFTRTDKADNLLLVKKSYKITY